MSYRLRVIIDQQKLLIPVAPSASISSLKQLVQTRSKQTIKSLSFDGFELFDEDLVSSVIDDNSVLVAITGGSAYSASTSTPATPITVPVHPAPVSVPIAASSRPVVLKPVGGSGGCCGGKADSGSCCKTEAPRATSPPTKDESGCCGGKSTGDSCCKTTKPSSVTMIQETAFPTPSRPLVLSQTTASPSIPAAPLHSGVAKVNEVTAHADAVRCIAVGNSYIASGSWDRSVGVWSVSGLEKITSFSGHSHFVESVLPISDSILCSGSLDRTVRLWSVQGSESREQPTLVMKQKWGVHVVQKWDDQHIVVADAEGFVNVVNFEKGEGVTGRKSHPRAIAGMFVDHDSQIIVTGGTDGTLCGWSPSDEKKLWAVRAPSTISCLSSSVNAVVVGCSNGTVVTYDKRNLHAALATREEAHSGQVGAVAGWGDKIVSGGKADSLIKVWSADLKDDRVLQGHSSCVFTIAVAASNRLLSGGNDMSIREWVF